MHYSYDCPTLSAAYVSYLNLQNHWVILHTWVSKLKAAYVGWLFLQNQWVTVDLWVSSLKYSRCLLGVPIESLSYNTLMGASP